MAKYVLGLDDSTKVNTRLTWLTTGLVAVASDHDTPGYGSSEDIARADHKHVANTATAVDCTGTSGQGVSDSLARADHTHGYAADSIDQLALDWGTTGDQINATQIPANFASPSNYTPDSADVKGHLSGIDTAIGAVAAGIVFKGPQFGKDQFDNTDGIRAGQYVKFTAKAEETERFCVYDGSTTEIWTGTDGTPGANEFKTGSGETIDSEIVSLVNRINLDSALVTAEIASVEGIDGTNYIIVLVPVDDSATVRTYAQTQTATQWLAGQPVYFKDPMDNSGDSTPLPNTLPGATNFSAPIAASALAESWTYVIRGGSGAGSWYRWDDTDNEWVLIVIPPARIYQAGDGITIDTTTEPDTIEVNLDGTSLEVSGSGLKIKLDNANTWTGTQTHAAPIRMNDNHAIEIGTGDDDEIVHNGTNTVWEHVTGDLIFDNINVTGSTIFKLGTDTNATDFQVQNDSGTPILQAFGDGTVSFCNQYFDINASGEVTDGTWKADIVALEYGGTEANLSATGPGVVVQTAGGAALSVESALDETRGGTGITSYTAGDILYASATDTLAKLAKGTNDHYLHLNAGTGALEWAAVTGTLPTGTTVGSLLYWNGANWVEETAILATGGNSLVLNDTIPLKFGTGGTDDTLVADGFDTTWTHVTGSLIIDNQSVTGATFITLGTDTSATYFEVCTNSNVPVIQGFGDGKVSLANGLLEILATGELDFTGLDIDLDPTGNFDLAMDATKTVSFHLSDNLSNAFLMENAGGDDYIKIGTLDAGEVMAFGNATSNPVMNFLGTGQKTVSGNMDVTGGLDVTGGDLTVGGANFAVGVDGIVDAGTWNATKIAEAYGGTNQSTYAQGDMLYASAANTLSKLTVGTSGMVLKSNGTIPVWDYAGLESDDDDAGAAVATARLVYYNATNDGYQEANGTALATGLVAGVSMEAGTAGNPIRVSFGGRVTLTLPGTHGAVTRGDVLYLAQAAGGYVVPAANIAYTTDYLQESVAIALETIAQNTGGPIVAIFNPPIASLVVL